MILTLIQTKSIILIHISIILNNEFTFVNCDGHINETQWAKGTFLILIAPQPVSFLCYMMIKWALKCCEDPPLVGVLLMFKFSLLCLSFGYHPLLLIKKKKKKKKTQYLFRRRICWYSILVSTKDMLKPIGRLLRISLSFECVEINIHHSKPWSVSQSPFKVVHQWPCKVPKQVGSSIHCTLHFT